LEKRILKGEEHGKDQKKEKKNKKAKRQKKNDDDDAENAGKNDRKPPAKPTCKICGKIGHRDENCWTSSEKNAKKRPANVQTTNSILKKSKYAKKTSGSSAEALFTEEQVSVMMEQVMASMREKYGGKKKPKHQVHFSKSSDSSSDSDSDSDSDNKNKHESIPYLFAYTYLFDYDRIMEAPMHQRQNTARYSAEIIVEIVDAQNEVVPIRALLDTGTSEMILLKPFLSPTSV
jgi:hypothetical protein